MYHTFMHAVDAVDNGVEIADSPRYRDATGLSDRVKRLNPRWNEGPSTPAEEDARFEAASALCGEDFAATLDFLVECELEARRHVEDALLSRPEGDVLSEIVTFPDGGMPWKSHLYDLESKHGLEGLVKFVLFTDQSGMWRVQAVTVKGTAFTNRVGLLQEWRGVRDADLEKLCGIAGAKFVHASGFIGGGATRECVQEMAVRSILKAREEEAAKGK